MTAGSASASTTRAPLRGLPLTECTVPALLNRQAGTYGDKTLLRVGELSRSYREVRDAAAGTAGSLAEHGVQRGDRVAALCGNRVELLDLVLGCAWLGAIAVPLNVALRGAALRHALANSGARVVVAESRLIEHLEHVDKPQTLEIVWALDGIPQRVPPGYRVEPLPVHANPVPAAGVAPGDTLAILYTSGTTGVSKGVCCPQAQFYWWGINVTEQLGIGDSDVLYTCLPLFHTNALNAFMQALVSGATYVLGTKFSASRFWSELARSRATITYLLGSMVNILYSRPPEPAESAHHVRVALAPATPSPLCEPFRERFGITLIDGYGSTETNSVMSSPADEQRPGLLGRVVEDFEAVVVDDNDVEVPDGTPGELCLRHRWPFAFSTGYFAMADTTVESWRNLWFHTGDRVVRDQDGCFRFIDRIKDAIRRRGENISSFEVEQVIGTHPAIESVATYAVPAEMSEDEVMVTIVLKPQHQLDPVELMRYCEPRLAYFAIPRFVEFADALPLTENGKVRKASLRERGVTAATWDREAAGYVLAR